MFININELVNVNKILPLAQSSMSQKHESESVISELGIRVSFERDERNCTPFCRSKLALDT